MTGPARKYRKDYRLPDYWIDSVDLHFDIRDDRTLVRARLAVRRAEEAAAVPLRLDGCSMTLRRIEIDGQPLAPDAYTIDDKGLTVDRVPDRFTLETEVDIDPDANTALEGLYRSGSILCTQCEAEGFSHITYFPDRPDVMARYRTTIEADADRYPVLLSNGDCVDRGALEGGRHYVVYEDPFAKPCYLFAMVAGNLACVSDRYRTASGREVTLRFYTDHGSEHELDHAIASLKQAMAWDEKVYGLEYDLDTYMVVAVDSFNMGAMENKGLNLFNTACILADPETATDRDFATVRDVIAHEYFHNWTGNRVTCRDWFQLSLKESLTVFREQQFAADHGSPGVTRIDQVRTLRDLQFPEDAGPTAHPVRPESYIEMNNFYTVTIYEKGAEIIRMLHRVLGDEEFVRGVRHYLDKHDGGAATIEDFLVALEEATDHDLEQFRFWYSRTGTPEVTAEDEYDDSAATYRLTLRQRLPAAGAAADKKDEQPLPIPVELGLLDGTGGEIELGGGSLLLLNEPERTWTFEGVPRQPVPSLLRGFSAPVKLRYAYRPEQLAELIAHDSDPVARWEAGQQLALEALRAAVTAHAESRLPDTPEALLAGLERLLEGPPEDPELLAEMLTLPAERYLADQYDMIDVDAVTAAHASVKRAVAEALAGRFRRLLAESGASRAYRFEPAAVGRRRLAALCLDYLVAAGEPGIESVCLERFRAADNMTDRIAVLQALRDRPGKARETALAEFEARAVGHPLMLDKWFALHAASRVPNAFETLKALLAHPGFDLKNPNRVRALLGTFVRVNMPSFHRADGAGYRLLADQILELDQLNPQIPARLVAPLSHWRRYAAPRRQAMRIELERIRDARHLSPDVYEMVGRAL